MQNVFRWVPSFSRFPVLRVATVSGNATKRLYTREHPVYRSSMREITLTVTTDPESGWLVASWDAPIHGGGITTQADSLDQLQREVVDAVRCYFDEGELPERVRLHFQDDPSLSVLEPA